MIFYQRLGSAESPSLVPGSPAKEKRLSDKENLPSNADKENKISTPVTTGRRFVDFYKRYIFQYCFCIVIFNEQPGIMYALSSGLARWVITQGKNPG